MEFHQVKIRIGETNRRQINKLVLVCDHAAGLISESFHLKVVDIELSADHNDEAITGVR